MQILFMGYEATDSRLLEAHSAGYAADNRPGPFDSTAQGTFWNSLTLAPPDIVWIHWESLVPPDIGSLRRFRVARPAVRMIVDIPDTLEPPAPGLGDLVGMGLYDIVHTTQTLASVIQSPSSYADAVRWQHDGVRALDATSSTPAAPHIIERVVEKRVALTNRPVLMGVWGALPGVGTSTLAFEIGRLLGRQNHTALLDHPRNKESRSACEYMSGLHVLANDHMDTLPKRLRVWPTGWGADYPLTDAVVPQRPPAPDWQAIFRNRTAAYLIVDAGLYVSGMSRDGSWQSVLWDNADLNVVLLPPSHTRIAGAAHWIGLSADRNLDPTNLRVGVFGPPLAGAYQMSVKGARIWPLRWPSEKDADAMLEQLLAPLLPDRPRQRGWFRRNKG